MISVKISKLIEEVFNDCHNDNHKAFEKGYSIKCECKTELNSNEKFEVVNFLTVGEIVDKFNIIFEEVYKNTKGESFAAFILNTKVRFCSIKMIG